mgnify:CR=1 FL=1
MRSGSIPGPEAVTARDPAPAGDPPGPRELLALVPILADAALLVDGDGRLAAMNGPAERLLGGCAAEMVGRDAGLLLAPHPEPVGTGPADTGPVGMGPDASCGPQDWLLRQLAMRAGRPAARWPVRDAGMLSVTVSRAGPLSAPLYLVVLRDIGPADRDHDRQRQILELAVEQSQAGLLIACAEGTIIYANRRMAEITGWTQEELVGRRPAVLKSDQTPPEIYAEMWQALREGRPWRGSLRNKRKDGSLYWVDNRIAPIRDATGAISHFVAVEQDITEMRQQEAELRRSQAEAALANRTKSKFLSNMSHELRTPLNAILGFSQMIAQEAFGPLGSERYLEYAQHIVRSGQHLQAIIADILDLSQIDLGRPVLRETVFDPATEIEACARMLQPKMAEAGLVFSVDVAPDLPRLRGDPLRFRQILINLLSNGQRFTPRGGVIVLAATCDRSASTGKAGLHVEIRDTGIGMTPAQVENALHPFRSDADSMVRRPGGAGLGMAIVAGLVEQHGARLAIDSKPDWGTSVAVHFPPERLVDPVAAAAEPVSA